MHFGYQLKYTKVNRLIFKGLHSLVRAQVGPQKAFQEIERLFLFSPTD
jgi:hypothetical protein